jgi:hypothetical protein
MALLVREKVIHAGSDVDVRKLNVVIGKNTVFVGGAHPISIPA